MEKSGFTEQDAIRVLKEIRGVKEQKLNNDAIRILEEIRDTEEQKLKLSHDGEELYQARIEALNRAIRVLEERE